MFPFLVVQNRQSQDKKAKIKKQEENDEISHQVVASFSLVKSAGVVVVEAVVVGCSISLDSLMECVKDETSCSL